MCGLRLGTAESDYLEYFFSSGTDFVDKDEFLDYLRGDLALYASRKAEAQKRIDLVLIFRCFLLSVPTRQRCGRLADRIHLYG